MALAVAVFSFQLVLGLAFCWAAFRSPRSRWFRLTLGATNLLLAGASLWFRYETWLIEKRIPAPHGTAGVRSQIVHKVGKSCPDGYVPYPDFFEESDGSKEWACMTHSGPGVKAGSIDYLRPGEGVSIQIEVDAPEDAETPARI